MKPHLALLNRLGACDEAGYENWTDLNGNAVDTMTDDEIEDEL